MPNVTESYSGYHPQICTLNAVIATSRWMLRKPTAETDAPVCGTEHSIEIVEPLTDQQIEDQKSGRAPGGVYLVLVQLLLLPSWATCLVMPARNPVLEW